MIVCIFLRVILGIKKIYYDNQKIKLDDELAVNLINIIVMLVAIIILKIFNNSLELYNWISLILIIIMSFTVFYDNSSGYKEHINIIIVESSMIFIL